MCEPSAVNRTLFFGCQLVERIIFVTPWSVYMLRNIFSPDCYTAKVFHDIAHAKWNLFLINLEIFNANWNWNLSAGNLPRHLTLSCLWINQKLLADWRSDVSIMISQSNKERLRKFLAFDFCERYWNQNGKHFSKSYFLLIQTENKSFIIL